MNSRNRWCNSTFKLWRVEIKSITVERANKHVWITRRVHAAISKQTVGVVGHLSNRYFPRAVTTEGGDVTDIDRWRTKVKSTWCCAPFTSQCQVRHLKTLCSVIGPFRDSQSVLPQTDAVAPNDANERKKNYIGMYTYIHTLQANETIYRGYLLYIPSNKLFVFRTKMIV